MSASFREIANLMDPIEPAKSIRRLAEMHRWPGAELPTPLSLRSLLTRHRQPHTIQLRFLFYNTYLLRIINVPVLDWVKDAVIEGSIPDIDILGPLDPGDRLEDLLGNLLNFLPDGKIPISTGGDKPALSARAGEIGKMLREERYDIAALCEVFSDPEVNGILRAWPRPDRPIVVRGADNDTDQFIMQGSGLLTISRVAHASHPVRYIYQERGNRYRDTDAWANKGVLRTEFDLGFQEGRLEVYSTHLFAGNDLDWLPDIEEVGLDQDFEPGEKTGIQLKQVDELVGFFKRTHNAKNVALIVGDFNIDAHNEEAYRALTARMNSIDMEDVWQIRNGTAGYTNLPIKDDPTSLKYVCLDDPADQRYCDDQRYARPSERIDYIFVERQKPEHKFILDFTRPRRRRFDRHEGSVDYHKIHTLSDHVGLDVTLIASPKPRVGTPGGMRL